MYKHGPDIVLGNYFTGATVENNNDNAVHFEIVIHQHITLDPTKFKDAAELKKWLSELEPSKEDLDDILVKALKNKATLTEDRPKKKSFSLLGFLKGR